MSDGHLFLSARGGADYASDGRHAWFDAAHQSVLVLSPRSRRLRQLPLDAAVDTVDAATDVPDPSESLTLYDFSEDADPRTEGCSYPPIVRLQMSLDGQFLAIQRSDIEVQVLQRSTRASYWVLCKSKVGNRILPGGVLWNTHSSKSSSSQDLFLVTKHGLEQYRVSAKRRSCALHRTLGLYVHEFWYAASDGVLLLSSGSRANEIVPFLLQGSNVEKLPRLVFSTSLSKQDLRLVSLYGEMHVVYSDTRSTKLLLYLVGRTKVTCVRSLNLMLPPGTALEYSVVDNLLVCHSLDFNVSLFFDIKCDGNVSDPFSAPLPISSRPPGSRSENKAALTQLIAGDSFTSVQKQFAAKLVEEDSDANEDQMLGFPEPSLAIRRALSVDDLDIHEFIDDASLPSPSLQKSPASHLASRRSARRLQRAMSAADIVNVENSDHEIVVPGLTRWRFHPPNFVQRSFTAHGERNIVEQVEIRKVQVNLSEVFKTCEHHPEVIPFLLRRGDHELAKSLVLKLIRNHILEHQALLSSTTHLISTVQGMSRDDKPTKSFGENGNSNEIHSLGLTRSTNDNSYESSRNSRGFLIIYQADFYRHVWKEMLRDSSLAKACDLSTHLTEYIKTLRDDGSPIETITFVSLAKSFIASGESHKLYQFLHYHVVEDSTDLADLMVRSGHAYPTLMQVGLDMYFRLGILGPLIRTLLDLGEIERAIDISWRNMGVNTCDASVIPAAVFFDSLVKTVSSPHPPRSALQVTQMLGNLLLFLKIWDPAALLCSSARSISILASSSTTSFPVSLLLPNCRLKLREAFGFNTE